MHTSAEMSWWKSAKWYCIQRILGDIYSRYGQRKAFRNILSGQGFCYTLNVFLEHYAADFLPHFDWTPSSSKKTIQGCPVVFLDFNFCLKLDLPSRWKGWDCPFNGTVWISSSFSQTHVNCWESYGFRVTHRNSISLESVWLLNASFKPALSQSFWTSNPFSRKVSSVSPLNLQFLSFLASFSVFLQEFALFAFYRSLALNFLNLKSLRQREDIEFSLHSRKEKAPRSSEHIEANISDLVLQVRGENKR